MTNVSEKYCLPFRYQQKFKQYLCNSSNFRTQIHERTCMRMWLNFLSHLISVHTVPQNMWTFWKSQLVNKGTFLQFDKVNYTLSVHDFFSLMGSLRKMLKMLAICTHTLSCFLHLLMASSIKLCNRIPDIINVLLPLNDAIKRLFVSSQKVYDKQIKYGYYYLHLMVPFPRQHV